MICSLRISLKYVFICCLLWLSQLNQNNHETKTEFLKSVAISMKHCLSNFTSGVISLKRIINQNQTWTQSWRGKSIPSRIPWWAVLAWQSQSVLLFWKIFEFINYNTITNYVPNIYELSSFDHMLGVVSQTTVSGWNRTHNPYANRLAHYPLSYQIIPTCSNYLLLF